MSKFVISRKRKQKSNSKYFASPLKFRCAMVEAPPTCTDIIFIGCNLYVNIFIYLRRRYALSLSSLRISETRLESLTCKYNCYHTTRFVQFQSE